MLLIRLGLCSQPHSKHLFNCGEMFINLNLCSLFLLSSFCMTPSRFLKASSRCVSSIVKIKGSLEIFPFLNNLNPTWYSPQKSTKIKILCQKLIRTANIHKVFGKIKKKSMRRHLDHTMTLKCRLYGHLSFIHFSFLFFFAIDSKFCVSWHNSPKYPNFISKVEISDVI